MGRADRRRGRPRLVLLDDADALAGPSFERLAAARDGAITFVVAGTSEGLRSIGHWSRPLLRTRTGVLLAPTAADGDLLRVAIPARRGRLAPGHGYLVVDGEPVPVRCAVPDRSAGVAADGVTAGIGVHVAAGEVRAAVVEVEGAAVEVVAAVAEPRAVDDDLAAALVHLAAAVAPRPDAPARVAWETGPATPTDVGGYGAAVLDALFRRGPSPATTPSPSSTAAVDGSRSPWRGTGRRRRPPGRGPPGRVRRRRLRTGRAGRLPAGVGRRGRWRRARRRPPCPTVPLRPLRSPAAIARRPFVIERVADEPVVAGAAVQWWRRVLPGDGAGRRRNPAR